MHGVGLLTLSLASYPAEKMPLEQLLRCRLPAGRQLRGGKIFPLHWPPTGGDLPPTGGLQLESVMLGTNFV